MSIPNTFPLRVYDEVVIRVPWETPARFKFIASINSYDMLGTILPCSHSGCAYFLPDDKSFTVPRGWTRSKKYPGAFAVLKDYLWVSDLQAEEDAFDLELGDVL